DAEPVDVGVRGAVAPVPALAAGSGLVVTGSLAGDRAVAERDDGGGTGGPRRRRGRRGQERERRGGEAADDRESPGEGHGRTLDRPGPHRPARSLTGAARASPSGGRGRNPGVVSGRSPRCRPP